MTAITNIISYSEIKIKNIKRRDYITKTLISFAKNYNYKKFGWIDYDKFKEKELEIIKGGTNINNFNTLNNILNNLNETVEDGESKLDKNNDIDLNPNIIKSDNNDINSVDENYDSGNNENIYKDEETRKVNEINDEYISKIVDENRVNNLLLDGVLKNESFNNYENLILDLIKMRNLKRKEVSGEDSDMEYIIKHKKKEVKTKIRYPKD